MSSTAISRRTVLARSAQAATFAALASPFSALLAAPGSRRFKIGACDWTLGDTKPTALDLAKQLGLDGVQIGMGTAANDMHLRRGDVQQSYRDAVRRTGLEISSIAIGEMNRVSVTSDPRVPQWMDDSLGVCKGLGLPIVLLAFFAKSNLDVSNTAETDRVVAILKPLAAKAEKQGITLALENYLTAEDNMRLIDRIGSPAVKVYYDVGNSTDKGHDILKEIRTLGKLICEMHAKDGRYRLGQGRIDFKPVRKALDDINYSGWIHLESSTRGGAVPALTADHNYLRAIFPRSV